MNKFWQHFFFFSVMFRVPFQKLFATIKDLRSLTKVDFSSGGGEGASKDGFVKRMYVCVSFKIYNSFGSVLPD